MKEKLLAEMDLGDRVTEFLESPVGIYLLTRIEGYEAQLLDEFRKVSAKDEEAIGRLQACGEVPRLFVKWLNEAISAGEAAEFQLKEEEG
jgi:hypothetical protein